MDGSGNNMSTLSSSTVEDTANQTQDGGGSGGTYSSNSLRRRKHKLRKRSLVSIYEVPIVLTYFVMLDNLFCYTEYLKSTFLCVVVVCNYEV